LVDLDAGFRDDRTEFLALRLIIAAVWAGVEPTDVKLASLMRLARQAA
jgi:hypothetical protein